MHTQEQGFAENGIDCLTTEGEWRIGTNVADLSEVVQHVYGKLIGRASGDVRHYLGDFYHDAIWCKNKITGTDPVTFWYVWDEAGTFTAEGEPTVARFRDKGMRVTVRLEDTGRGRSDAYLKFETIHRPIGWRK